MVLRRRIKCVRGETKDYAEKGRQAKEENKRIRGELKGADNAKERHIFMRGKIKSEGERGEKG